MVTSLHHFVRPHSILSPPALKSSRLALGLKSYYNSIPVRSIRSIHHTSSIMSSKKIITVFGATGNQGGSVIDSILSDPKASAEFSIRAITRDVNKPKAQALAERGAELATADLNDASSVRAAIKGSYGVYAVTNYWEKLDAELEFQQGKTIADASKAEGVQHLLWSSLLNVKELTKGAFPNVYHFDSKARVEAYIREQGIPATFIMPGFFMSNIPGQNLRKGEDGKWVLALAMPDDSPVPLFAPEFDSGKFAKAALLKRDQVLGKRLLEATDYITPKQMLAEFKELYPQAGEGAHFFELPEGAFKGILKGAGLPDFAAEELWENMQFIPKFGYFGGESLDFSKSLLDEPLTTWKEYLKQSPALKDVQ